MSQWPHYACSKCYPTDFTAKLKVLFLTFFIYRIGEATSDLDGAPYGGARYPVMAILADRTFARFHLDIGIGDIVQEPVEIFHSRDWLGFAQIPPAIITAISREQQFAEKIHAYTLSRTQNPNSKERFLQNTRVRWTSKGRFLSRVLLLQNIFGSIRQKIIRSV
jgi:hypothetical protein